MAERSAIVLGKGPLAIQVAEWFCAAPDWRLTYVVPVVPEPTWTDSLSEWADAHGVAWVESGHYADLPPAEDLGGDLAVSVFYDRILSAGFIDRFGRVLNIHNGPLPRYRGVSPINWALKNEERSHGVTIHEITPGIDDGPIVAQLGYSIYPDEDEVEDVYRRALAYGWTLFEQTMPILDRIEATAQDERLATYYSAEENEQLGERRSFNRAVSGPAESAAGNYPAARPA
ncbi:MAG TPA: formyltransferase family protein [Solirubrobacterales bacterium]|nr:formyltransferase family protein [Solirubrobacterales bacterium]